MASINSRRLLGTKHHRKPRCITSLADGEDKTKHSKAQVFNSRRVVLQRKATIQDKSVYTRVDKTDPSRPNPGIFSRAVKKAIGGENTRVVVKHHDEPKVEYEMDSDVDEEQFLNEAENLVALVTNLPHGMTETRLRTLAGDGVQVKMRFIDCR
ncbi:hypothetical protein EVAR_92022_1 [Eumeta japonica]|uniref:Uncharacterized protein n=1 Tax=Eumeta variegata TaxID=151549 RepID=A0A4C1ZFD3_EUMVA|nr:hypothetical protein EVAR_92022_1 [Eumeta japonica]